MTELPDRLVRDALRDTASTPPSPACVDANALAAWADDSMTRAERAALETHAAGCVRCLALLATMTRSEPAPVAPTWWRRSPIGWLMPLAAVAAGLVIVVRLAMLEQRQGALRPPTAPAAAAPAQVTLTQAAPAPAQPPATSRESKAPASFRRQKPAPAARDTAAPPPAALPEPIAGAPALPATALVQTPPPAQAAAAADRVTARPDQVVVTSDRAAMSPLAGGGGGRGGGRAFSAGGAMKVASAGPPPVVIYSPDPASRWRIVGGTVEHTADGAASWQPQSIGVSTPMRAGFAPAAHVCWLAGAAGVVLRTTDGTTWTRIAFPEPVELVAIQATDASHATVTTADGRRLTTNDGGASWIAQAL